MAQDNLREANLLMEDAAAVADASRKKTSLPELSFDVEKPVAGNTPNKRGLKYAVRFAAAHLFGKGNLAKATKDLQDYLDEQQEVGQCCQRGGAIETGSTSHGHLHLGWAALALWALARRKPQNEPSKKLLESLRRWWKNEMRLVELCRLPDDQTRKRQGGQWWTPFAVMPNWRAWESAKAREKHPKPPPANACRDICARLIFDLPLPPTGHSLWKDRFFLGAALLRELDDAELRALRPPAGWKPPLPFPLQIRRFGGGEFVATYDVPEDRQAFNQPALLAGFFKGEILGSASPDFDMGDARPDERVEVSAIPR